MRNVLILILDIYNTSIINLKQYYNILKQQDSYFYTDINSLNILKIIHNLTNYVSKKNSSFTRHVRKQ